MSFVRVAWSFVRAASALAVVVALLLAASAPQAHAAGRKALRCAFAKQRAVVHEIEAVLECRRAALRAGASVDPACIAAASAKLEEDFARAEMRGGCVPEGDLPVLQATADLCAQRIGEPLQGSCTEAGDECGGGSPPCCTGLRCIGRLGATPMCAF
ncbi:hypothetical protein K2Z84_11985 [Candidatus Binatia bacterium]|nr:hypothetical protein [Candidatus Binatia bacterium]